MLNTVLDKLRVDSYYQLIIDNLLVLNKVLDKLRVDSYYQLIIDNILVLNRIRCQLIIIIS